MFPPKIHCLNNKVTDFRDRSFIVVLSPMIHHHEWINAIVVEMSSVQKHIQTLYLAPPDLTTSTSDTTARILSSKTDTQSLIFSIPTTNCKSTKFLFNINGTASDNILYK